MDEQTPPPLAIYPAPKKPKQPKPAMPEGTQRALFLIAGLAIGGVAVYGAVRIASHQKEPLAYRTQQSALTQSSNPGTSQAGTSQPGISQSGAIQGSPNPGAPTNKEAPAPGTNPGKTGDSGSIGDGGSLPPYNPFAGDIGSSMPPKEIGGHLPSNSGTTTHASGGTTNSQGPSTINEAPTPKGLLVTVRLDVGDPNSAVKALDSVASKLGGAAIQYDESAAKLDAEGAIVFVPVVKADEAEKALASVGSVVATDKWNGSTGDRLDKIEQNAQNRLSDLHLQRQELLIKYFEDAPQIKHIDEDSDRINKCLAALRSRKPGPNTAVFKIRFLS